MSIKHAEEFEIVHHTDQSNKREHYRSLIRQLEMLARHERRDAEKAIDDARRQALLDLAMMFDGWRAEVTRIEETEAENH